MHAVHKSKQESFINYLVCTLDDGVREVEAAAPLATLVRHIHLAGSGRQCRILFRPATENFATFCWVHSFTVPVENELVLCTLRGLNDLC